MHSLKRAVARFLFGPALPQEFTMGMRSPQNEVGVWLCGKHGRRDVTNQHSTACSDPFVLCIRLEQREQISTNTLRLEYVERSGNRILGQIGLKVASGIQSAGNGLHFFEPRSVNNRCLPVHQRAAHSLMHAYQARVRPKTPDLNMTLLEQRAADVTFIRPHPIGIGSVEDVAGGNIFILNLMGELGEGRFGFGLRDLRWPAHLVERSGRMALSSVPSSKGQIAFFLTKTHLVEQVDWGKLPFEVRQSSRFNIRVPAFALRVRELELETIRKMGSHNFFIARVISDEQRMEGEELHALHGFFQAWRMRGREEDLRSALVEDATNKQGLKMAQ
jgi:hypothetical protein